ncbi:MAG: slipin family protein [Patescibacteria group bacterium]
MASFIFWGILAVIALIIMGFRVLNQYEKGIILTLGRYSGTRNAGLTWIFPGIQTMLVVDLRLTTIDIPKQEVITKDNVPAYINGVVYFSVLQPEKAVLEVKNYTYAISQYAQAALRDVIGGVELDVLLSERDKISDAIEQIVEKEISGWGIKVSSIKIQDIELPSDMKRLMAQQAEAERERRAVIIRAEGELTASENMKKAAENLTSVRGGLSLRTLTTIEASEKSTIFVLPIEFVDGFKAITDKLSHKEH